MDLVGSNCGCIILHLLCGRDDREYTVHPDFEQRRIADLEEYKCLSLLDQTIPSQIVRSHNTMGMDTDNVHDVALNIIQVERRRSWRCCFRDNYGRLTRSLLSRGSIGG